MSDKDYHEGYFEGVRATLLAYMHFQEEGNLGLRSWIYNEDGFQVKSGL